MLSSRSGYQPLHSGGPEDMDDKLEHEVKIEGSVDGVAPSRCNSIQINQTVTIDDHESEALITPGSRTHPTPVWMQVTFVSAITGFLLYVVIDSATSQNCYHLLKKFFKWLENHEFLGPVVYILTVIAFALLCIPESVLAIGGGYIFSHVYGSILGVLLNILLVVIGGVVGSCITFLAARYLIQDTVQRWAHKYRILRAIDEVFLYDGFKMVLLLRLSPIVPFNVFNYIMGVTLVSMRDFLLGSIGMIPWVCVCSYAGSALKSIEDISMNRISQSHRTVTYISYGVGIVCTAIVVLTISWYTRRAFHHVVAQQTRIQAERISTTALVETKEQEGGESPLPQTTMPLSAS